MIHRHCKTHLPVRRLASVAVPPPLDVERTVREHGAAVELVHLLLDAVSTDAVDPVHVIFVVARLVVCGRMNFVSRVKKRQVFECFQARIFLPQEAFSYPHSQYSNDPSGYRLQSTSLSGPMATASDISNAAR